jgi:hypothetical protein
MCRRALSTENFTLTLQAWEGRDGGQHGGWMMADIESEDRKKRKQPPPRTYAALSDEAQAELSLRVYLSGLSPHMTMEESIATTYEYTDNMGRSVVSDHARRVRNSEVYQNLTRRHITALVEMGLIPAAEA